MKSRLYIYIVMLAAAVSLSFASAASAVSAASTPSAAEGSLINASAEAVTAQTTETAVNEGLKTNGQGVRGIKGVKKEQEEQEEQEEQNVQEVQDVSVGALTIERNGQWMEVDMSVDLSTLDVGSNRAVLFTPRLVNGSDSLDLPSIGVYGRQRYYYYLRNNGVGMITGKDEKAFRAAHCPDTLSYHCLVPFSSWMDGSQLTLDRLDYGCCRHLLEKQSSVLGSHAEAFFPELVYATVAAEQVKSRSIEGSAYIDFPVDETTIYPDYRRNTEELAKISASIDKIRDDSDVTLMSVSLKGFASPEGKYAHNAELAYNRTLALKSHILRFYKFDDQLIDVSYKPEDWDGIKRFVLQTNLENKEEILHLMDGGLDPDELESRVKASYPDDYRFLFEHCYPALRRTDYRILYNVRNYNSIEEIVNVMRTSPQKLSLNEFYLVAQQYEPGSEEFTEVFETAVRMFPDDEMANLNAANAAMGLGDLKRAERYLAKAGNSPQAAYARGALAIRNEDYQAARTYMQQADALGVPQAREVLQKMNQRKL